MDFFFSIPSIIISFVLFSSAISKFFSYNDFIIAIRTFYKPKWISINLISYIVIGMELILAVIISLNFFATFAFIISSIMFLVFTLFFLKSLLGNQDVSCNCFGIQNGLTNKKLAVFRNMFLIGICIIGSFTSSYNYFFTDVIEITTILITSTFALITFRYLIHYN